MKYNAAIIAVYVVAIMITVCIIQVVQGVTCSAEAEPETFALKPKDRPVLETVQQVQDARITGTCAFEFDGMHYVITDLPKEYVDYSSWYVRMP